MTDRKKIIKTIKSQKNRKKVIKKENKGSII